MQCAQHESTGFQFCKVIFHYFQSVQFSHSVTSDSLLPHESQHARPPCPSSTPGVHSDSTSIESVMPSSHLILCHPLLLLPSISPSIRVFSNESTLCDPMNCSTPGLPVHHQLLQVTQTHVHRVGDTIQPSLPLSSPSPPAPNPSQHQSFPMSQFFA